MDSRDEPKQTFDAWMILRQGQPDWASIQGNFGHFTFT
jgi:hypothetical protein